MKYLSLLVACSAMLLLTGCNKDYRSATVERNCTGVYIDLGEKTYAVCNGEVLEGIPVNTEVQVYFKKSSSCPQADDLIVCMMYFEHDGYIEVLDVK